MPPTVVLHAELATIARRQPGRAVQVTAGCTLKGSRLRNRALQHLWCDKISSVAWSAKANLTSLGHKHATQITVKVGLRMFRELHRQKKHVLSAIALLIMSED